MKEQELDLILRGFDLFDYKDQIIVFKKDQFILLNLYLEARGYEATSLGRVQRPMGEQDKGLCSVYEEWVLRDVQGTDEETRIILQDGMLVPRFIHLARIDEYVVISNDQFLPHELCHVKDNIEHPEVSEYRGILADKLNLPDHAQEIMVDTILNVVLDYSVDSRLKYYLDLGYSDTYSYKVDGLLDDRWTNRFANSFEIIVLTEGIMPEKVQDNFDLYWPLGIFYRNQRLLEWLNRSYGRFLTRDLLLELIDILNDLIDSI